MCKYYLLKAITCIVYPFLRINSCTENPSLFLVCIIMCVYLGTDATHAEHIETIKSRNYVGVQGDGCFVPGELGMGLVEGGAK